MLIFNSKCLLAAFLYCVFQSFAFADITFSTVITVQSPSAATIKNGRVAYLRLGPHRFMVRDNVSFEVVSSIDVIPNSGGATFSNRDFLTPIAFNNLDSSIVIRGGGGLHLANENSIQTLLDSSTTIPQGGGTFTGFGAGRLLNIDENNIAFQAGDTRSGGTVGIYALIDNTVRLIADESTLLPNTIFTFEYFRDLDIEGRNVVFSGQDTPFNVPGNGGVYTWNADSASIITIADETIPCPNTVDNFTNAFGAMIDDSSVVFRGVGCTGNNQSLWTNARGFLEVVVEENVTPDPNSNGTLESPDEDYDIEDGRIVFCAGNSEDSTQAIYMWENGTISTLFAEGDNINGFGIGQLGSSSNSCNDVLGRDSLSGNQLVFNGTIGGLFGTGLYIANLDESNNSSPTETTVPIPLWSILISAIIIVLTARTKFNRT